MKKSIILFLTLLTLSALAAEKFRTAPLLALRLARQGYENMIWMEQRVKVGGESVTGYLQGTGGADDALMGFMFEDEWDMLVVTVGFMDTAPEGRKAEFFVEAGPQVLYSSGTLESKGPSHKVRVPIRGHKQILLRITGDRYNGTAGAAWGEPTLLGGLTEAEMQNDWSISVNNKKTPLPGNNAPSQVLVPFDVPTGGTEVEYRVKISKDTGTRTVIVVQDREDS